MIEMESRDAEMDDLLRRSLAAPIPNLPSDFEQRLLGEVRGDSRAPRRYREFLLGGYSLTSVAVCAALMREQGLDWAAIAAFTLTPLTLIAAARPAWRAIRERSFVR